MRYMRDISALYEQILNVENSANIIELGDEFTLIKQAPVFDDRDSWLFKSKNNTVGYITIGTRFSHDRQSPRVIDIKIKDEARGFGLARKAIPKLVEIYGELSSDNSGHTSEYAKKMWQYLGARKPSNDDTPSGDAMFILTKNDIIDNPNRSW